MYVMLCYVMLTDTLKKTCDCLALQKMATAVSVESRAQNQSFVSIEN